MWYNDWAMFIWQAIILGAVEGLTEFLPISSTGHLILTSELLKIAPSAFLSSFEIAIQLGAIAAIIFLYARRLIGGWEIWKKIIVAFLPTAVIGLLAYPFVKNYFLSSQAVVLWALFIGGVFLVLFEKFYREKSGAAEEMEKITYQQAVLIGFCQALAVVPGVSRAAATIVGGLALGLKRRAIVEFSFLLAVPTMLAASGLDLFKTSAAFSGQEWLALGLGFAVAFVVALAAVKFLLKFIQTHAFSIFGWYRVALALLFWALVVR